MSGRSSIEWTDATWNPVTGCTKVSPGCDHCYAETLHERFHGKGSFATVTLHPDRLDKPLRWRKPRKVFVNSMSDLFHKDVPDEYIARVFAVMAYAPQHTFQVLTKRHGRMRSLLSDREWWREPFAQACADLDMPTTARTSWRWNIHDGAAYVLDNVWLGVSVENQQWADIRVPALLETPAAVRFLSCEPLLGPVNLGRFLLDDEECFDVPPLDWVIVGGESGPGARAMHPDWARTLRDQCTAAGVPFLFKQWGAHVTVGQMTAAGSAGWELRNGCGWPDETMVRLDKKAAGRELDGRTWDEYPVEAS